jgi:two-component system CheB/CheR fusion protein
MDESTQTPSVPRNIKGIARNHLDFPVVGIGASAGGLQALQLFFECMPEKNDMAFVVILHLSPKHHSNAAEILQQVTKMPVITVNDPTGIQKDHIYIIPPGKQLSMSDGYLRVSNLERPVGQHVAIDLFFRSLADTHRERAIGIVLSGTGADGAIGLSRLKEQGGITIAQQPNDTQHDGMPLAAIATGIVDFVLPVKDMPQKLMDLWSNARIIQLPPVDDVDAPAVQQVSPDAAKDAEQALQDVIAILRSHTGHDFRHYKRATVLRRIERRLQVRGVASLPDYRAVLKADPGEGGALLNDMLIGVTNFFRDREAFEALEREVIPQLFMDKQPGEQVRVWVAACSSGEEAYSIAMLLNDQESRIANPPEVQIFATDIDDDAIAVARKGAYPFSVVADIPPPKLHAYFVKDEAHYRIKKTIRDKMLFASHNLLRDPPFSKLDLISCRNLLIYLNREMQSQVLEMFHFALSPGGYLFLGSSESADVAAHFFTPVDKKNRIYRAKALSRSTRYAPAMPFAGAIRTGGGVSAGAGAPNTRKFSFAEVHQRVLAQHAPPSVIVNHESGIVHMSDRAGRFLRHIGGEPSRNLVSLVHPELRLELRTALFQATQTGKTVETRRVEFKREGRSHYVNMTARPFHDDEAGADFILVLFNEVEECMNQDLQSSPAEKQNSVLTQLEEELQRTKEQLQDTIEHSETSTEELKASNEELQAINEELRSMTEELETSKEELQSVNEELITVNYELKIKVEETGKVNDDLNNLIASTNIATVFVDRGMRIKRFTPRATDVFNIIPSDIGRSLLDITHRLDYEKLPDDTAETFESLRMVEREVSSSDGRVYIARLLPYRTTEDRIDGAVLTFIDITARRQAEEKLRTGEERMRLVAESTKDYAIITTDTEGRITSFNNGAERIFGFAEQEALGQMIDIIFTPEDREQGIPDDERRHAREEGRAEDERWHFRKDGSRLFCSGVMTPLRDGDKFYGYAKIARDQTSQLKAMGAHAGRIDRADIARAEAQAANALRDEFLAIMSHELRHPLNLIHINAELLARLPEVSSSPLGAKASSVIRNAVAGQAKIIDDLLDLSRVKTGKLTLTLTDVDLSAAVNSIVDAMQADPAAAGLTISVTGGQAPLVIRADLTRVEQVILNLLSNAVKFTLPGGHITVRLTQEQGTARLDVIDDGKGIAPEFLPGIFNMFGQATQVTTRSRGGLGIGLALAHQIAELHGGRIEAASEGLGKGSRFSVWFPLYGALPAAASEQENVARHSIAGLRILLIDDMEDLISSFKMLLEFEGATVYTATRATEALKILDRQEVDLVISDIAMPDMDGHMFIEKVRKQAKYANLPAIAVSGMGRPKDIERAREAGFSAHLGKPVSLPDLIKTVKDLRIR